MTDLYAPSSVRPPAVGAAGLLILLLWVPLIGSGVFAAPLSGLVAQAPSAAARSGDVLQDLIRQADALEAKGAYAQAEPRVVKRTRHVHTYLSCAIPPAMAPREPLRALRLPNAPALLLGPALGAMLAQALGTASTLANPTTAADLAAAVRASTTEMRRSWAADPATARLPFPQVQLLSPGVALGGACTPGAPARKPAPTAIYCPSRAAVLLVHELLALAFRFHNRPAVAYWIAVGLADHLQPPGADLAPAPASLRSSCLAGVLLAASGNPQPSTAERWVRAAARAYGDHASATVGTGAQRAWAALSGLGATGLDCSAAAMARLATGQVTVPADLGTRGPGSLGLEVACR